MNVLPEEGRNSSSHCVSECVIQRVICIVNVTIKFWRYLKIPQERFGETFPQDPVNIFTVNYIKSSGKLDVKLTTSNRSRAWDILLPKGQINYHQTNLLATGCLQDSWWIFSQTLAFHRDSFLRTPWSFTLRRSKFVL